MLALAALLSCFALSPDLCPTASAAHGHGTMLADSRPEPALAPISVTDCNLRRVSRPGKPDITVTYPMLGRKDVDRDVADWVERIASTFEAELAPLALEWQEQELPPCELIGSYTLTRPSANALSIVFEIWTYTGGAHGNLDVIPLTYSLLSGQRLGLVDIFENVDKALEIMSAVSRKELATRLGGGRVDSMIHDGTEPLADNFSALALVPAGCESTSSLIRWLPGPPGRSASSSRWKNWLRPVPCICSGANDAAPGGRAALSRPCALAGRPFSRCAPCARFLPFGSHAPGRGRGLPVPSCPCRAPGTLPPFRPA